MSGSRSAPRTLLVTGASSGIGRAVVEALSAGGHTVWATVRRDADEQALSGLAGVNPLRLDVRDPDAVRAGVARVREAGAGLDGLVNNAGIGPMGPFSTFTDDEIRDVFEINVFGVHRMTNACLPMLLESGGRVVTIGSQGGMITQKYFGPYTMTKHALEAYTDALAEELSPHGVSVSIVDPGGVLTAIGKNAQAATRARLGRAESPFDAEIREFLGAMESAPTPDPDAPESETNRKPLSPSEVADVVLEALLGENPRRRYIVGTRWEGTRIITALLARVAEVNASPLLEYPRDELVSLLDEYLGARNDEPGPGSLSPSSD